MKRFFTILVAALLLVSPVSALPSESLLDDYDLNHIWYYDPTGCVTASTKPSGSQITWIGDSYSVGSQQKIKERLPGVDLGANTETPYIKVSKHFSMDANDNLGGPSGLTLLKQIIQQKSLRPYLVFALGTNDPVSTSVATGYLNELMSLVPSSTHVILTTAYTLNDSYSDFNSALTQAAKQHTNLTIADWATAVANQADSSFAADGVHPNSSGYDLWLNTIIDALPGSAGGESGIALNLSSTNLPTETIAALDTAGVKDKVTANLERYQYAEQETGLPWQILAALHFREGGLGSNQSISNGEKLYDHTNVDGIAISADANQDAKQAAVHFISMAKSVYGVDVLNPNASIADYGQAFLAYNRGYMYKSAGASWEDSPYVMNGYDATHLHMKWTHADSYYGSKKLNSVEGLTDANPGALAVLAYLGGLNLTSTCSNSGPAGSVGALQQKTLELAWPEYHKAGYTVKTPAYQALTERYASEGDGRGYSYLGGCSGVDCGAWVSILVRESGWDPDYNSYKGPTSSQERYLRESDKWQALNTLGQSLSESDLRPGDVAINSGHTYIYVGEIAGFETHIASASLCERAPMAGHELPGDGNYVWYRKVR